MSKYICKICKNEEGNKAFLIKEMMFGFLDEFVYFQCHNCRCLQINEIPINMEMFYPSNFYSFNNCVHNFTNTIKQRAIKLRNYYAVFNKGILGMLLYSRIPCEALRGLSGVSLSKESRILDVGCGSGLLLNQLKELGFCNLIGIDPYIEREINEENRVRVMKKTIHDITGKWDLIMLHHSFEHLADPLESLFSIKKLLSPGGTCLIRIPVVDSWAWENYKENWVQVDAPRHFFLHSRDSIKILAEKTGLMVEKIIYESTTFQFIGSEQYKRNIYLKSEDSYFVNPSHSIFSKKEIKNFKKKANELNLTNTGDIAVFYLKHI